MGGETPPVPPHAAAGPAVVICCMNLATIVFLQRIVVPLGGELGVSCLLPIAWLSMAYLLLAGLAVVDGVALFACTAFLAVASLSQLFGGANFSITSLALLMAIYVLSPVRILLSRPDYRRILRFFQWCVAVVALATLAQYAFQVLGLGMPILEDVVPARLIVKDFNYLQEVVWNSGIYKPNGIFMLEASFLSQFLGLALIVEFWLFRRVGLMLLFSGALVLTFSGTGMLLAATTLAVMVWKRGADRYVLVLGGAVACLAMALLATGWLDAISGRLAEFSDRDSSASTRFVAPFTRVHETLVAGDLPALFWGSGAGFIDKEVGFAWNPPIKVWVEYGLVTWAVYWGFLVAVVRATPMPMLTLALALEYLLFGGGALLQPPIVFACLFLGIGYLVTPAAPTAVLRPGTAPGRPAAWSGTGSASATSLQMSAKASRHA